MVSARYRYARFLLSTVSSADRDDAVAATNAQIIALAPGDTALNTATIAFQEYNQVITDFAMTSDISTIDITPVNTDDVRRVPGRTDWSATLTLRSRADVLQHIVSSAGDVAVMYIERVSGVYGKLSGVVGVGTTTITRSQDGNEVVTVELYNVAGTKPEWRS